MVFGIIAIIPVSVYATEGIKNNGLGGISIDIDGATYNDTSYSVILPTGDYEVFIRLKRIIVNLFHVLLLSKDN